MSDRLIAERYRLIRKIGQGAFGTIFLGSDITNGEEVAIKVESVNARSQLPYEHKVYRRILLPSNRFLGIPRVHCFTEHRGKHVLVMDLLGSSLEELFNLCSCRFTMKTVLMLVNQMLRRIEHLHESHYIHNDIKPGNFLMGIGKQSNKLFMIDFGLAKKYRSRHFRTHIDYEQEGDKGITGTARFASINTHLGKNQSRRDDMESLGYVMMYFLRGSLPWQGVEADSNHERLEKIGEIKMSTRIDELCEGFPVEFATYFYYCKSLRLDGGPDYFYLQQLFRGLFERLNLQYDFKYDWTILQKPEAESTITHSGATAGNDEKDEPEEPEVTTKDSTAGNDENDERNEKKQPQETELKEVT